METTHTESLRSAVTGGAAKREVANQKFEDDLAKLAGKSR